MDASTQARAVKSGALVSPCLGCRLLLASGESGSSLIGSLLQQAGSSLLLLLLHARAALALLLSQW